LLEKRKGFQNLHASSFLTNTDGAAVTTRIVGNSICGGGSGIQVLVLAVA